MKKIELRPHPDSIRGRESYMFGDPVPVNIFIGGQKVEAPTAGIKVGRPMNPAVDHCVAVIMGDFIDIPKD